MNYDEIPPGREMDALVAEKVMGWIRYNDSQGWPSGAKHTGNRRRSYPRYSTDIAAAWEVVEKLLRDNGELVVAIQSDDHDWVCTIRDDPLNIVGYSRSPTAPLAICRAALMTVLTARGCHTREKT